VYIPTFIPGSGVGENASLDWASVDDEKHKLDEWSLKPVQEGDEEEAGDYQLALTGDVFRWMLDYAPLETMQRVSSIEPCRRGSLADLNRC
jgi:cation-transporting ATPase 13A2